MGYLYLSGRTERMVDLVALAMTKTGKADSGDMENQKRRTPMRYEELTIGRAAMLFWRRSAPERPSTVCLSLTESGRTGAHDRERSEKA